jgi:hypothetical protein
MEFLHSTRTQAQSGIQSDRSRGCENKHKKRPLKIVGRPFAYGPSKVRLIGVLVIATNCHIRAGNFNQSEKRLFKVRHHYRTVKGLCVDPVKGLCVDQCLNHDSCD